MSCDPTDSDPVVRPAWNTHVLPACNCSRIDTPAGPNDLSRLVPGAQYRLDFPDTCALNTPIISIDYLDYEIDPVFSTTATEKVRLDQLDVTVTITTEGLDETVLAGLSAIAGP